MHNKTDIHLIVIIKEFVFPGKLSNHYYQLKWCIYLPCLHPHVICTLGNYYIQSPEYEEEILLDHRDQDHLKLPSAWQLSLDTGHYRILCKLFCCICHPLNRLCLQDNENSAIEKDFLHDQIHMVTVKDNELQYLLESSPDDTGE